MTEEQMRIAIAEKRGYKKQFTTDGVFKWWHNPLGAFVADIPNYPSDLNACHEMEKFLEMLECNLNEHSPVDQYTINLCGIRNVNVTTHSFHLIHTTALQRCEAFCRVFWPEKFT